MAVSDPVISGKYGCAEKKGDDGNIKLYEVTAWNYNEQSTDVTYASCETNGQRKRVDGDYDITGTIDLVWNSEHDFRDEIAVDDHIVLILFKRKPTEGLSSIYDEIPAKILGISGGVTIEGGGPQRWQVSWGLDTDDANPAPLFSQSGPALEVSSS